VVEEEASMAAEAVFAVEEEVSTEEAFVAVDFTAADFVEAA